MEYPKGIQKELKNLINKCSKTMSVTEELEFIAESEERLVKLFATHNVRLSCYKEVFEKFKEIEHESEFYGWLYAKAHEA
jgi:hypothetical protein